MIIIFVLGFNLNLNKNTYYLFHFSNSSLTRRIKEDDQFEYRKIKEDEFRQKHRDNKIKEDTLDSL